MASDDVALDSDSVLSDQPAHQNVMCKTRHRTRKRGECFFYVNADSAEADTLKDRFWRDLDQGKIAFDKTEDLYTRVKRGATKVPSTLRLHLSQSNDTNPNHDPAGTDNPAVGCLGEVNFLSGSSTGIDASTPASSGYDSSSIPSVGPVTAANSPADTTLSHSVVGNQNDMRLETREVEDNESGCGLKESSCVRKRKHFMTESRKVFHKSKKSHKKFYELVDASSDAADTLKDKFWRDLEMGKVNVAASADLYSAVKVSRNRRPGAVSLPNNSSNCETSKTVTIGSTAVIKTELFYSQSESSSCDKLDWSAGDTVAVGTNNCDSLMLDVVDKSSVTYQMLSDDIVDNWLTVTDSKLQSPCAVTVERLSWTYSSVGDSTNGFDIKRCLNLHVNRQNNAHKIKSPKLLRKRQAKRTRVSQSARSKRYHMKKRRLPLSAGSDEDTDHSTTISNCAASDCSIMENVHEQTDVALTINNDVIRVDGLLKCSDVEKPCSCLLSAISWLSRDNEPVCVRSKGSLIDFIKLGDSSSVRLLLNHRSLPISEILQSADSEGMTPLMRAASLGHCDIIDILIRNGACIDAQSISGMTSLMIASEKGLQQVVDVLLKFGAQVELCTTSGETALMKAVRNGHSAVVELLLSTGVNTAVVSRDRQTACSIARSSQHLEYICGILDSHISRRVNLLHDTINTILRGTVNIVDALFPLHCFALRERRAEFSVNFSFCRDLAPEGTHALLFIGHHRNVDCWLQGPSSIGCVHLNGTQLVPLGEEQFIFLCQPLRDNNQLDLRIQNHQVESNINLLVCAYFIQPSDTLHTAVTCGHSVQPTVTCQQSSEDVRQLIEPVHPTVTHQRFSGAIRKSIEPVHPTVTCHQQSSEDVRQSIESVHQTVTCQQSSNYIRQSIESVHQTATCQQSSNYIRQSIEPVHQTVTCHQQSSEDVRQLIESVHQTVTCQQSSNYIRQSSESVHQTVTCQQSREAVRKWNDSVQETAACQQLSQIGNDAVVCQHPAKTVSHTVACHRAAFKHPCETMCQTVACHRVESDISSLLPNMRPS